MARSFTLGILDHFRHFRHFSFRHFSFRHFSFRHFSSSQSGMAYMAILILLAILSTLGFGFIFKVGTQTSATMTRGQSMQAHYFAETAANHALWGLLNQPGFAPASDIYYMHSLANGRYGYKVRKPTETTFATIATVGGFGNNVVNQSYVQYIIPSNVLTVYGNLSKPNAIYRRLIGTQWTDPADFQTAATPGIYWTELEGCPTRKEIVVGILDGNHDISLAVWDGTVWANQNVFTQDAVSDYKCFDIAYESQSGDALVVGRTDATTTMRYNIWDGTAWAHAAAQPAFNLNSGALTLVTMASCPGNDDILIATVNWNHELELFLWNGSAFSSLGTIEISTQTDEYGVVQIVYERQSGDALILWAAEGIMRYRVWNGVALGPELTVSGFIDDVYVLRAAEDPASDHIVVAAIDKFCDITVAVWDGTAWTDSREVSTAGANYTVQCLDVAWEASGEDALVVWAPWLQTNVRALSWRKGTALADSTVQEGPDFQDLSFLVRLLPISGTEKIVLLGENWNLQELRYSLWDGDRFKGDPAILLESDIPVNFQMAFDLAEANVPRTGGTGTGGGGGNLAPVVDAGPDQTIYLPDDASLDGTVTDDGLPDPPATVTTTWSKQSGPGTVTFDDASLIDAAAQFSEAGEYVLRLTADDSDLNAFDEVIITVESHCNADYTPDTEIQQFAAAGTDTLGLTYLPEGKLFNGVAAPAGGAWLSIEASTHTFEMQRVGDGGFMTSAPLPTLSPQSVTLVTTGAYAGYLATVDNNLAQISYTLLDLSLTISGPSTPTFGASTPVGIGFIETTVTGSYDSHLAVLDRGAKLVCIVDQAGNLKTMFPAGIDTSSTVQDVKHLPGTDKLLVTYNTIIRIFDFSGSQLREYDPSVFGLTALKSTDINPLTCDHVSIDATADIVKSTNFSGGGSGKNLLFVVPDASSLGTQDSDRKALMEGWGHTVTPISASATQAEFDAAVAINNVAYVSEEIVSGDLGTKLKDKTIGVVNEDPELHSVFGFSTIRFTDTDNPPLNTDSAHYITSPFGGGAATLFSGGQPLGGAVGTLPSGLEIIGEWASGTLGSLGGLLVLDTGAVISGGGTAAGRRVQTPWGGREGVSVTDINALSEDGQTIMQRAIEWASIVGGGGSDTDPPTPDPMTWASPPTASGPSSITMTATTASDASGVEYYFECTGGGGNDSGWQSSPTYVDSGLSSITSYTYRVKARDKAATPNETGWSAEASATTWSNEIYVNDIAMGFRISGNKYYGQATVWINGAGGAVVSGNWSGSVSGTSMGTTGTDGRVMLESPDIKDGGTFTFTVTSVVNTGYTYNPGLNVETFDSITAP